MNIARTASRLALIISAAIALAPSAAEAQSLTRANTDRITPIATSGCSGISWAKVRTAEGEAYPVVTDVDGSSPADHGGIKEGAVILAVNGRDARTLDNWFAAAPGEEVVVKVQRAGKDKEIRLTAGRVQELAPEKAAMQCVEAR